MSAIDSTETKYSDWTARSYSDPRMMDDIPDWPNGRHRVTAKFFIEQHPTRGERAIRETTGAPKKLTYARKARIVTGDDGRTYIAELTAYGHIAIMRGDMKYSHEAVFETDPRYPALLALFR